MNDRGTSFLFWFVFCFILVLGTGAVGFIAGVYNPAPRIKPIIVETEKPKVLQDFNEDGIPVVLYIDGLEWRVFRVGVLVNPKNMAETNCETHTITYKPMNSRGMLKNSLLHEVFHAGACSHGGNDWWNSGKEPNDHPGIYHLADFTYEFSQTNPEFIDWLERK